MFSGDREISVQYARSTAIRNNSASSFPAKEFEFAMRDSWKLIRRLVIIEKNWGGVEEEALPFLGGSRDSLAPRRNSRGSSVCEIAAAHKFVFARQSRDRNRAECG